jgi:hypothetical protein
VVTGNDLFQLIDGAGEKYMAYGFRQLARTDYRKAGTELVITAEIYDMGSPLGAFGQYSMLLSDDRDPATLEAQAVALGGGGFLGTSQLVFWKGQHLVQLNLVDDAGGNEDSLRQVAREALPPLATRLAAALPGEGTPPRAPQGFASANLVWGGTTYLAQHVFGVDQSGAAWVGHYRAPDGARWRVAHFERTSEADVRALVAKLRVGTVTAVPGLGDEAFHGTLATGDVTVARKGNTVLVFAPSGISSAPALPVARRLQELRTLIAALP